MIRSGSPRPVEQTLLVGTGRAVAELHHILKLLEPSAHVIGCLLPYENKQQTVPVPVLGGIDSLTHIMAQESIDLILVSFPVAKVGQMQGLVGHLNSQCTPWRFIPMLADQLSGNYRDLFSDWIHRAGEFTGGSGVVYRHAGDNLACDPLKLLQRRPRPLEEGSIHGVLSGRTVLITGAGGSIGSQLALGVASFNPDKLVLVERSENSLFEIDRQLASVCPQVRRASILHDVTDMNATAAIVCGQKPDVVFHTAAHKHVPMMEEHPAAAIENNFYGTRSIAEASAASGVDRFVMISTDKAVNPSSVMGASKRLAELYIQDLNVRSDSVFCMVRFGNVLDSACSVLPIWRQQLADGGPLTVTHPDMYRYFMTIQEAAGLVLQSAALSCGGEVFLLDMGQPVRILDLAHRFLRSQGLEPDVDVAIRITGIRPGEKMFEQLAYDSEDMSSTRHESIHIWHTRPPEGTRIRQILTSLDQMRRNDVEGAEELGHWRSVSRDAVIKSIRLLIPEMASSVAS